MDYLQIICEYLMSDIGYTIISLARLKNKKLDRETLVENSNFVIYFM